MKDGILKVWFSELNYWMTKYNCRSYEELEATLWCKFGVILKVL